MDQSTSQNNSAGPQSEQPQQVPTQALPSGDLSSTHIVLAVLSYFIFFLPLFFDKEKHHPFVVHHMNQGFCVFIIHLIYILIAQVPFIGMFAFIISILNILLIIFGIVSALNRNTNKLPVIGEIRIFNTN